MKYLLNEAATDEQEQVKLWLDADAANLAYYTELKRVWDSSRQLAAVSKADANKAWARFKERVSHAQERRAPARTGLFGRMRVAASVIIIVGLGLAGYWLFTKEKTVKGMIVEAQQKVVSDTLPDRSVVTINKGSSIAYPSRFRGKTRPVTLKGEAFFNVTPDKNKPFIISVNDVQITVVGTSFNVKSTNGNTEVVVETGIVRVTKAGASIELKANEKIIAGTKDSVLAKEEVSDHLYNYYRTKEFVCDDTPLWKLVDVLNEAYGVNIVIGRNELKDLRMNTTFYNESLDQVLNVISLTFGIRVTKEGDRIILQ